MNAGHYAANCPGPQSNETPASRSRSPSPKN
jgi:hypothetical protein